MMKFLWKRNKEFTFIHSCWMFTQVCRNSVLHSLIYSCFDLCFIIIIFPQASTGHEVKIASNLSGTKLAILISYSTRASGIIVLLKTAPKYGKLN